MTETGPWDVHEAPQCTEKRNKYNGAINHKIDHNKPPFSRLFVVCSKQHNDEDLRRTFEEHGIVEDVWVVKDKETKQNRGIAFIKYSKMSEACLAIDFLDNKKIDEKDDYPLKVTIAQPKLSRSEEGFGDNSTNTLLTRIFIVVPKSTEENELREIFGEFGEIDSIQIVKDRITGQHKGFAYIKYTQPYGAANAIENSPKTYKALIAEPKTSRGKKESLSSHSSLCSRQPSLSGSLESFAGGGVNIHQPMELSIVSSSDSGIVRSTNVGSHLEVRFAPHMTTEQLGSLFGLIPGMELCTLKSNSSSRESKERVAVIVYNSVGSAIYSKEKLDGFEYPPGYKISVNYAGENDEMDRILNDRTCIPPGSACVGAGGTFYCSARLPTVKPLADSNTSKCVERLFIVCQPSPPPPNILLDVFSRFGDLIDVFMLKDKNFGYAKFASAEAAQEAMGSLHGIEVFGKKLKVLPAEPPKTVDTFRKQPRR